MGGTGPPSLRTGPGHLWTVRLTFNSGVVVPLPVGTADPGQRLRAISAGTRLRKQHPDEGIAGIMAMPASLARLGVAWARHAAATHINLYVTNVPGPPGSLHLARARLLEATPSHRSSPTSG